MQEGDALALRAHARDLVDEADAGGPAARERAFEIVDGEADVMDPGPPARDEAPDRRVGRRRLEQLDERLAVVERMLRIEQRSAA